MADSTSLKHHFLIAMPGLASDYFTNSITYLCEHNDDGALGIMINRPSDLPLARLLEQLEIESSVAADDPVLVGGPVQVERGFILHTDDKQFDGSLALGHGLVLSTAKHTLEAIARGEGPRHYLVALGYAGWGPGQLETELGHNVWLTCPAVMDVIFEVPFAERVDAAAQTLGIDFRLMSHQAGRA